MVESGMQFLYIPNLHFFALLEKKKAIVFFICDRWSMDLEMVLFFQKQQKWYFGYSLTLLGVAKENFSVKIVWKKLHEKETCYDELKTQALISTKK